MTDLKEISSALQSSDEETRRSALRLLQNIPFHDAEVFAFHSMGDESWRVRKEAVETYVSLKPGLSSVQQLLSLLRNQDNAGLRNSAAETIIRLGTLSTEPLLEMIQDRDADVRKFVIDVMGAIGDSIFVSALLLALNDPDVNVASAAAEQLGVLGKREASEDLIRAILTRDDVLFRFSALGALGLIAKPAPVPEGLLKLADQPILKKSVLECLGNISDDSSFKLLLDEFYSPKKNIRIVAVKALYKINNRVPIQARTKISEAIQLLKENDIVNGLIELNDNRDYLLTEALIWIGVIIRDNRFIPLLIGASNDERTYDAAFAALKSFGREAVNKIISQYSTLDENGRICLCDLLAEGGYTVFNDVIHNSFSDTSPLVRKAAARAAGKLGLITLLPDLIALIDDSEAYIYDEAISSLRSLVMISSSDILKEVNKLCSSKKSHHRKAAVFLLAALGQRDSLLMFMKDEDPQVRKSAVMELEANSIEAAGAKLVLALTDEDPDVRIAVADALGNLCDITTLDALEHALNDQDVWVQSAVLKAIFRVEPTHAMSIIKNIHPVAKGLLMITCLQILEEIGGAESEKIIRFAMQSSDLDIARQAAKSLGRVSDTT